MFHYSEDSKEVTLTVKRYKSVDDLKLRTPYLFVGKDKKGQKFISTGYLEERKEYLDVISSNTEPIKENYKKVKYVMLDSDYFTESFEITHYAELSYPEEDKD